MNRSNCFGITDEARAEFNILSLCCSAKEHRRHKEQRRKVWCEAHKNLRNKLAFRMVLRTHSLRQELCRADPMVLDNAMIEPMNSRCVARPNLFGAAEMALPRLPSLVPRLLNATAMFAHRGATLILARGRIKLDNAAVCSRSGVRNPHCIADRNAAVGRQDRTRRF
jgi:hypothetical protein